MNGIQPHQTADKMKSNAMKLPVPSFNARGTAAGRDGQQITSCNIFSASPPYLVSRLLSSVRRPLRDERVKIEARMPGLQPSSSPSITVSNRKAGWLSIHLIVPP
jgi:hypothetical protein